MLTEKDPTLLEDTSDLHLEIDTWNSELKNRGELDNYFHRGKTDGAKRYK